MGQYLLLFIIILLHGDNGTSGGMKNRWRNLGPPYRLHYFSLQLHCSAKYARVR